MTTWKWRYGLHTIVLGLDTNITKHRLNMFAEIPEFFSKYLEHVLNILKTIRIFVSRPT